MSVAMGTSMLTPLYSMLFHCAYFRLPCISVAYSSMPACFFLPYRVACLFSLCSVSCFHFECICAGCFFNVLLWAARSLFSSVFSYIRFCCTRSVLCLFYRSVDFMDLPFLRSVPFWMSNIRSFLFCRSVTRFCCHSWHFISPPKRRSVLDPVLGVRLTLYLINHILRWFACFVH